MKRALLVLLALLAVGLVATVWMARGTARTGVAVIGDQTPQLLEAAGFSQALPLHTAALTVVSVDEWDKLPFISDMHLECAGRCEDPYGIVRLLRVRPGGSDRLLFVNHEGIHDGEDPVPCVAQVITAEIAQRVTADTLPPCAAGTQIRTLWQIPGFGTW